MGDTHKDLPWLAVPLGYESLERLCQALVPGLVTLHYLADILAEDNQVVVLVENPCGYVIEFCLS